MHLRAITCGRDRQPRNRWLKPLFFRQLSKVFGLLKMSKRQLSDQCSTFDYSKLSGKNQIYTGFRTDSV